MVEPSHHCPYVGLKQNRAIRFAAPTPEHRCYVGGKPIEIPVDQARYCLSQDHTQCPLYLGLLNPAEDDSQAPLVWDDDTPAAGGLRGWLTTLSPRDRRIYLAMLGILALIALITLGVGLRALLPGDEPAPTPTLVVRAPTLSLTAGATLETAAPTAIQTEPATPTDLPHSSPTATPTDAPTSAPLILLTPTRTSGATSAPAPTSPPASPAPTGGATSAPAPTNAPTSPPAVATPTSAPPATLRPTQEPTSPPARPTKPPTPRPTAAPASPTKAPAPSPTKAPAPRPTRPPAPSPSPIPAENARLTLYFGDPSGKLFVPVQRRVRVENRQVASAAVRALIEGPRGGLQRLVLPDVVLRSISIDAGTATVDFDRGPTGQGDTRGFYAIVLTLTELPNIQRVQFQINGKALEVQGRRTLERPVLNPLNPEGLPEDYSRTAFLPLYFASSDGSHDVRIIRMVPKTQQIAAATARALLDGPGAYEFALRRVIPAGTELRGLRLETGGTLTVDFTQPFADSPDRSAAVRTLVASLTTIPGVSGVQILVEGRSLAEQWGNDYAQIFRRPAINPEE